MPFFHPSLVPVSNVSSSAKPGVESAAETARLAVLHAYEVLDTPAEAAFDRITTLAARLFEAPIALVSLVDRDRQWFKSCYGFDEMQTGRDISFCAHALVEDEVLVVPDAENDPRFIDNPLVTGDRHIRFYAGAPLRTASGATMGTLCVLDTEPREFDAAERATLSDLAAMVVDELELRLTVRELERVAQARRAAQEELARSEARFKSAFQFSPIGMALLAVGGNCLQVNARMCEILGAREDQVLGDHYQGFTHPDDLPASLALSQRALRGEIHSYQIEKRYLQREGRVIWSLLNVSLVRDDAGAPLYFIAQVQDISERKRAEDNLRRSEALKAAILEAALDCIVTVDADSHVLEWNPAAERTFGYSREQAISTPLYDLIVPPELRQAHRDGMQRYLETREGPILGQRLELPAMRADGTRIIVELAIVPIPGMQPPLFTGQMRDITERKATEAALRESEARYGRIAANVPGMVYQFVMKDDGTNAFPFVSHGSREIYGVEPEQIVENPSLPAQMLYADDATEFYDSVMESARTLNDWKWEGRITTSDGQTKWLRGSSRPQRETDSIIWDGLLYDITPSKIEQESLQTAKAEAERANFAKSEFLSRMSHELRTPLNAILGFGQLLEMATLAPDDEQSVEQIVKAGRHLLGLINEVLDIARIESGHLSISPEAVSASEIALEALDLVRPLAGARGITLAEDALRSCDCYVRADRQRLKQILLNLLSNAVKYNRACGQVALEIERREATVRLWVRDTGAGIAPDLMERLWTPFDRLGAESTGIEGTGVGLAVSKSLAQAMDGELGVQSIVGQGSAFWLDLPLASTPLASLSTFVWPEKRALDTSTEVLVLYIEDNPSNLQLVQRLLAHRPEIRLLSAMEGALGWELARQHCPDVILLDMHLPDLPGHEVLRRLKANQGTASIPVLVLSADATPSQVKRALDLGAQSYLSKPLDVREFLESLDAIVARAKSSDNNCHDKLEGATQ